MRLLAVDTTGPGASVAVLAGGEVAAERPLPSGTGLAEALVPALEAVLADAGTGWAGLDLLVVVTGPGGFTGVRAGVAAVRGLALATGLEVLPVTRLAAVAEGWSRAGGTFPLLVALDVRRGELVAQRFGAPGVPEGEALLGSTEEVMARIRGAAVAGDGAALLGDREGAAASAGAVEAGLAALRALAAGARPVPGPAVRPFYARAADARPGAGAALVSAAG